MAISSFLPTLLGLLLFVFRTKVGHLILNQSQLRSGLLLGLLSHVALFSQVTEKSCNRGKDAEFTFSGFSLSGKVFLLLWFGHFMIHSSA